VPRPATAVDDAGIPLFVSSTGPYGITFRRWRADSGTAWYETADESESEAA
jgi:hypothetical protein